MGALRMGAFLGCDSIGYPKWHLDTYQWPVSVALEMIRSIAMNVGAAGQGCTKVKLLITPVYDGIGSGGTVINCLW